MLPVYNYTTTCYNFKETNITLLFNDSKSDRGSREVNYSMHY